ncbi:MAG: DUF962 domain-containing protein [Gammaproteobacteria bacterium]|nr:DUF962 domain-containing protein [Gammaproteobacteria bacterium]
MTDNNAKPMTTFAEFWPYYLGEHKRIVCRAWHYFGTAASILVAVVLIASQRWEWLWLVLIAGYGPAWIGHYVFEKNRPATFRHPFWSLMADYKMFGYAITGRLGRELEKIDNAEIKN